MVFYKCIPAHNVFVLYILQYLTFALHFVGQGPVSMYNNFIYAMGFSPRFFLMDSAEYTSRWMYTQYTAFYRCKPMFSATTAHCSIKSLKTWHIQSPIHLNKPQVKSRPPLSLSQCQNILNSTRILSVSF